VRAAFASCLARWALVAAGLLAAALAANAAFAQGERTTAEALMRESGLWAQLGPGLAAQVRSGFAAALAERGARPSESESQRLDAAIEQAFAPGRLRASALDALAARLERRHVPALRAWYGGSTGGAITRLEEATAAPGFELNTALAEGVRQLGVMQPARRELLQDVMRVARMVESMTDVTLGIALAVQAGVASMDPGQPGPSAAQLRAEIEKQRPQLTRSLGGVSLALLAATYRGVPDGDLQQYRDFLASTAGRHFNEAGLHAMQAALLQAAHELGRALPGTRDAARS
jgi:hypothetical protein